MGAHGKGRQAKERVVVKSRLPESKASVVLNSPYQRGRKKQDSKKASDLGETLKSKGGISSRLINIRARGGKQKKTSFWGEFQPRFTQEVGWGSGRKRKRL